MSADAEKALAVIDRDKLRVVLATDCGSTTTKAVLFEKTAEGWRQTFRGEAPTTVEKPVADVTIGATNAFLEIQELSGRKILANEGSPEAQELEGKGLPPFLKNDGQNGIDLYVSTSSAGGGLQMIVAGVVGGMTTQSAERAALGAGAIVMDAISLDDGRETHERVQRIRHLRPDIILLAGGTDGGTRDHPLELAEIILQADPRPRFGETIKLPVIYAANSEAAAEAKQILEKRFSFVVVDNLRPTLERENLAPARDVIHDLFLHHVMSHAPGYSKLLGWSPVPIIPTPAAFGEMVQQASKQSGQQILAVDIGGATTDVFSVVFPLEAEQTSEPVFNRTVSANLGMSYSVANVLLEAGEDSILRWLPFELSADDLRDRLRNKMIRPTTIPQTMQDLVVEQAVCREALRLALAHHKRLAVGLQGGKQQRGIADLFRAAAEESLINMMRLDLIVGSGGVLSHAPNRRSSAFMLIDAYEPEGVTALAVDSIFMMPHLGVFSTVHPEAAKEIFFKDCLVPLGTVVAPVGGRGRAREVLVKVEIEGETPFELLAGELICFELPKDQKRQVKLSPESGIDVGKGPGVMRAETLSGGEAGLVFDGRGRPLSWGGAGPKATVDRSAQVARVRDWYRSMNVDSGV